MQKIQGWAERGGVRVGPGVGDPGPPGPQGPPGPPGPPGTTISNLLGPAYLSANDYPGADGGAKMQAALNALPASGGVVNAQSLPGSQIISSTVTIKANQTLQLGAGTYTCTVTSGPVFNLVGNTAKLLGLGSGNALSGYTDPGLTDASGVTNLVGSALGAATDMIRIAIPAASRTSLNAAILYAPEVRGLWINMGASGRHGLYATSNFYGQYHDLQVFNGVNGSDGFRLEGDLASPNNSATSYFNVLEQIQIQPLHSNTTGFGIHFDASNGEVAWSQIVSCRASGNITNGGGLGQLYLHCGAAANQSINHTTVSNGYYGNPVDLAGSFGIKILAPGSYAAQTGGKVIDLTIRDVLIERLFTATNGVALGAVSSVGPDVRSGTGVGALTLIGTGAGANWATAIDSANLGQNPVVIGDFSTPGAGNASLRLVGTTFGGNAAGISMNQTALAAANSDGLFGLSSFINVNANGKTGLNVYNAIVEWGSYTAAGGTVTNAYSIYTDAPGFATNNYALFVNSGLSQFMGPVGITNKLTVLGNVGIGTDPGGNPFNIAASISGANAIVSYQHPTLTSTASGQNQWAFYLAPTFAKAGFNPAQLDGLQVDMGGALTGGGTATIAIAGDFTAPVSGATTVLAVRANGGIQMVPNIAKPVCVAAYRGTFWVTQGAAGVKDNVEVCAKDATDAYAWRTLY
jgi:hypothetical protein